MGQGKDRSDPEMGTSSRGGSKAEIVSPKGFGASLTGQICIALVKTVGIVLALTLFVFQTNYDYTAIRFYLSFGMMALNICLIIAIGQMDQRPFWRVYWGLVTLVYSMALVCEIQTLMGGNHPYTAVKISIAFCVNIFIDLVVIFGAVLLGPLWGTD